MQCFKLVNGGFVDKVIVFDSLPERLYKNVETRIADGFPRAWARWLAEIGSTRTVFKTETEVDLARNWKFKHTPVGKEPCFFVLNYQDINKDKESWRNICEYVKMKAGPETRLREKIDDMAINLSPNPTMDVQIEPEDVPVISLPSEKVEEIKEPDIIKTGEVILVEELAVSPKKKPGRPKKVVVGV